MGNLVYSVKSIIANTVTMTGAMNVMMDTLLRMESVFLVKWRSVKDATKFKYAINVLKASILTVHTICV